MLVGWVGIHGTQSTAQRKAPALGMTCVLHWNPDHMSVGTLVSDLTGSGTSAARCALVQRGDDVSGRPRVSADRRRAEVKKGCGPPGDIFEPGQLLGGGQAALAWRQAC